MKKRILSFLMVFCMVLSIITNMSMLSVKASNTANDLVSVAQAELGNGYSKYTHYVGSIGGTYNYAWCAAFVSWCGNQAGVPCICKTASCYTQYQYMTSHGGYEVSNPQAGDVVFFYCNSCSGTANKWCHIGIMINSTTSIDGNYNNKVSYDNSYSHYGSLGYKHSSGIRKIYVRPNYGSNPAVLPGTIDSGWSVPTYITATRRITTYDQWANAESDHYIDPGDNCYITEVYTNGFVKVQYPVSNGKRWAYAKASDFQIPRPNPVNNLPETKLHAWVSAGKMGSVAENVKYGEILYLCYRVETTNGNLLGESVGNYSVKETIYYPNGETYTYTYGNNNNWIGVTLNQWGAYRGVVEISGDYSGKTEVTYDLSKDSCTHQFGSWITIKKPTCITDGSKQRKCSICGKTETQTIKAAGHNYTTKVVEPTYTQKGYTLHTCSTCGYSYKDNYKDVKSKQLTSISVTTMPGKTSYYVSEPIDTTGMKVTAFYSDASKKEVTGWKTVGNTNTTGNISIRVEYTEGGKTASTKFTITVKQKTATKEDGQDEDLSDYEDPDEDDDSDSNEPLSIGDEITTDEAIYTVTKLGDVPCVEYSEMFDDEVTQEVIPDSITVDGLTYLVTSVGAKAFYKNTNLKQVTIGENVTEIGNKAFYGCSSLSRLIIKSEKLKSGSVSSKAFTKVAKNVRVYVPGTKYSTYKKILKKAGIGSKAKFYKKKL